MMRGQYAGPTHKSGPKKGRPLHAKKEKSAAAFKPLLDPTIAAPQKTRIFPPLQGRETAYRLGAIFTLAMTDLVSLALAISLAFVIRIYVLPSMTSLFFRGVPRTLLDRIWLVLGIGLVCLLFEGLYTRRMTFWQEAERLVKAISLAFLFMLAVVSLGKMSRDVSRTVLVLGYLMSITLLPVTRLAAKKVLAKVGLLAYSVIILGAGKTGELVARILLQEKSSGYRVVGFLEDDPAKQHRSVRIGGVPIPVLGGFRDSGRVMQQTGVRHLIVAAPGLEAKTLVGLVNRLQQQAGSVTVVPDFFGIPVMGVEADYAFDEQMFTFRVCNNLASPLNMLAKRAFDFVVGSIILVAVSPVLALMSIAIKLDSSGPIMFSHRRIGRRGEEFDCHKFRTMVVDAQRVLEDLFKRDPELREQWERDFKLKEDPRVTRVGKLLRRTSLDELPQIFNVLRGEMSLVGPRPRPLYEGEHRDRTGLFDVGLNTRPGMTGLWQVSGRSELDFTRRLQLDAWYVRNWSLFLDVSLILRTIPVLCERRGAY